jgi:hypothetical protein
MRWRDKKMGVAMPALNTHQEKSTQTKPDVTLPRTVAVLPFINKTDSDTAFEVVRRTIFNHFASKNYHALHWKDVDMRLKAAGLADPAKLETLDAANLASTLGGGRPALR